MTTRPLRFEDGESASIAVEPARRLATPRPAAGPARWLRAHLTDEWLVVLLAAILSITFYRWYAAHGLTVAFNDARSREMIARRVLMSRTPGLAQLGSTWLPLPGLLMLPLIWNDTLFRDGLAGSLPAMTAYVIAGLFMYRSARLVTDSRPAGWVAAGVLLLNPNVLYMQGTPMSELPSLGAFVVSIYYALRLMRTYHALDVVKCAAAVAAGTLIRYENWVLGMALVPILAFAAWRRRRYELAEAWTILYSLLAFAGCAAWILYNTVIFHDPLLSFFYGQSDHRYYANTPANLLPARHHAGTALKMYGLTVADTAGWVIIAVAALGFVLFLWRNHLRLIALPAYVTLLPFAFYWLVLYMGVNTESLPQLGNGPYYNVRFGLLMIPALALFSGYVMTVGQGTARRVLPGATLAVILVISAMSSIRGTSLVLREALHGYGGDTRQTDLVSARWLSSHYHGGDILYTYVNDPSLMFYLLTQYGFPDRAFITDANGAQFSRAVAEPQRWVTWIVINNGLDNSQDPLWSALHRNSAWRRYFVLRGTFPWHHSTAGYNGTVQIFERRPATGSAAYHARASQARPRASVTRPRASVVLRPLSAHGVDETSANARLAIDNDLSTAWKTSWYLGDPVFGGLKHGSGLILDMGHPVRLSSLQVTFGPVPGADVQIKVGNSDPRSAAAVSAMTTIARADDVGGTHAFTVRRRATGRYVLIWFTRLAPEAGAPGRYQAEIFNVLLRALLNRELSMHSRYAHISALAGAIGCAAICLGACSALPTETQGSSGMVAKPPPVPRVVSLWQPGQFQTGIQLYWHTSGTTSQMEQDAARSLNYIVSLGANSVGITFSIYTDGVEPTHVYAGEGTPSMESLSIVLAAAKARGLRVMLRPEIDENNIAAAGNGAWRGTIHPANTATWFASYDQLLVGYARLARKYAVNELVAGTELFSLQTYTSQWEQLKSEIRAAGYEGNISYAINWNNWSYVPFTSLGLDAYPSINLGDNATVAQLSALLKQWLDERSHSVRARLTIQEAGIPALSGMYVHPWFWGTVGGTVNLRVQANWFSAVCQAAKAAHVQGLYYWMLDSYANPAQPGPDETMSSWLGRPAEQSIRSCFKSGQP